MSDYTVQYAPTVFEINVTPAIDAAALTSHAAAINGVHGLTTNISAALAAAASPSAGNAFTTMAETNLLQPKTALGSSMMGWSALSFIPTGGRVFWARAGDIANIGEGQPVASWISRNGVYLSASGAARPLLKLVGNSFAVRFNGSSTYMNLDEALLTLAQPFTMIVVASNGNGANTAALFDGDATDGRTELATVSSNYFWYAGSTVNSFSVPVAPSIHVAINNGSLSELRVNGSRYAQSDPGTNALHGLVIGAYQAKDNLFWTGDIYHVLIFNRVVSIEELESLEYYLSIDCGLSYRQVICDGDSRTTGIGAAVYYDYPSLLARSWAGVLRLKNFGIGGYPVTSMNADAAARIDPIRMGQSSDTVVILGGVNDIILYGGTAASVYASLKTYWAARRAAGFKVVACTEIDANSAGAISANWRTVRAALNVLIRSDATLYDALADLALDATVGVDGAADAWADKIHPDATGYAAMAVLIKTAINSL